MKDQRLVKFIEMMSDRSGPLLLSYGDFLPLDEVIDYKTITYNDGVANMELSDFCRKNTKRIIMRVTTNKRTTSDEINKSIQNLKTHFHEDIDILLGSKEDDDVTGVIMDLVLYKE